MNWRGVAPDRRRFSPHCTIRGTPMLWRRLRMRARQVGPGDFARFGWILAMDRTNLRELEAMRPSAFEGHLGLFLDLAPELGVREVPDPYYGGRDGFERVLDLVEAASPSLIERIRT